MNQKYLSWVEVVNLNCSLLNPNKGQFSISCVFSALAEASGKQANTVMKVIKNREREMKTNSNGNNERKTFLND